MDDTSRRSAKYCFFSLLPVNDFEITKELGTLTGLSGTAKLVKT